MAAERDALHSDTQLAQARGTSMSYGAAQTGAASGGTGAGAPSASGSGPAVAADTPTSRSLCGDGAACAAALHHHRQQRQRCLLHAWNSLVQHPGDSATAADFDAFALRLSPRRFSWLPSPDKAMCGNGNWSVQVLMLVAQSAGLEVEWFDRRKGAAALPVDDPLTLGLIVNRRRTTLCCLNSYHWFTLRRCVRHGASRDGPSAAALAAGHAAATPAAEGRDLAREVAWFNMDSTLRAPALVGSSDAVKRFAEAQLGLDERVNVLVVKKPAAVT